MKKILLAAVFSCLSVSIALPQQTPKNEEQSAGFRLEVLGGSGLLCGKKAPGEDIKRLTFHGSLAPSVVLKDNHYAIGILAIYRQNRLMEYDYGAGSAHVDWSTFFIGPQCTLMARPHAKASFLMDMSLGGVFLSEKMNGYSTKINGFGTTVGIGGRFSMGHSSYFIAKLSILAANLDPDWAYDERLNVSSINFSMGFSFGK